MRILRKAFFGPTSRIRPLNIRKTRNLLVGISVTLFHIFFLFAFFFSFFVHFVFFLFSNKLSYLKTVNPQIARRDVYFFVCLCYFLTVNCSKQQKTNGGGGEFRTIFAKSWIKLEKDNDFDIVLEIFVQNKSATLVEISQKISRIYGQICNN